MKKPAKEKRKKNPLPHGAICYDCAIERGGKPVDWAVTMSQGNCPYCGKANILASTHDYHFPHRSATWD